MEQFFPYGEHEIAYLKSRDKRLGEIIDKVGMVKRRVIPDLFAALVHSIVGQQIATKAHETIWRKMTGVLGEISPEKVLGLSPEELQAFGITFRKVDCIRSAARKIASGEFDIHSLRTMSDAEVCAKLSELDGIGVWTAEMLMQAIDACENKWLKVAFHLAFAATVRIGELLGLTWDCVDVSEEAIAENRAYIFINKQVERVSRNAVDELDAKEVILIFPSQRKNNKTVRLLKTPKTDTSERKVYIPKFLAQILVDIKKEQDELKDILGSEYQDYNLVMATTFGLPIGDSYLRD